MKKIITKHNMPIYSSKIFDTYFGNRKCGVFDIETTGLSFTNDKIILTALLTVNDNIATVTQFLATSLNEESAVVKATLDYINEEGIDYLLTYNGASFDMPFLAVKATKYQIGKYIDCYILDLYRVFRNHSDLSNQMSSLSQKSMEKYLGIADDRFDTIDGKKSVELFKEYLITKEDALEKTILTHNREDVIQLYRLLEIIKYTDFHGAMYKYGFPYLAQDTCLSVTLKLSNGYLTISGNQISGLLSIDTFGDFNNNYEAVFDINNKKFQIKVPAFKEANGIYIDASFLNDSSMDLELINGYLILEEDKIKKHREINIFSMHLIDIIILSYSNK
ncbi:MAG: hypothetical protein GX078_04100 [Clostridiales bacterium]|nr:hypothetical protein [Clostridiales bacterium]